MTTTIVRSKNEELENYFNQLTDGSFFIHDKMLCIKLNTNGYFNLETQLIQDVNYSGFVVTIAEVNITYSASNYISETNETYSNVILHNKTAFKTKSFDNFDNGDFFLNAESMLCLKLDINRYINIENGHTVPCYCTYCVPLDVNIKYSPKLISKVMA